MNEALASLIAAAALIGAPVPRMTVPRAAPVLLPDGESVVLQASLKDVAARQNRAFVRRPLGSAVLEAAAAFDADGNLWFKLRSGAWRAAYAEDALRSGVNAVLPQGLCRLKLDGDALRVTAAGANASFDRMGLIDALYAAATRVKLAIQPYAALTEDGSTVPASLCLLRRARPGEYFVTSRAPGDMKDTQWFMATGGKIYGMRFSGRDLVFVSKPLPPAARNR